MDAAVLCAADKADGERKIQGERCLTLGSLPDAFKDITLEDEDKLKKKAMEEVVIKEACMRELSKEVDSESLAGSSDSAVDSDDSDAEPGADR